MAKKKQAQPPIQQGSLFEEDYLIRTLGALVHNPEVALTELVANAWDAGATTVDISISGMRANYQPVLVWIHSNASIRHVQEIY